MNLLAVDTSTENCSVALWLDGACHESGERTPRGHARLMPRLLAAALAEHGVAMADLDGFAYGRGPGSFTGIRIAAAFARGLALGHDRPVIGISSLAALAEVGRATHGRDGVLTALDARMGEVYWGAYDCRTGVPEALVAEAVVAPEMADLPGRRGVDFLGAGPGWSEHADTLRQRAAGLLCQVDAYLLPGAGAVATLAAAQVATRGWPTLDTGPVYLRDQVIQTPPRR